MRLGRIEHEDELDQIDSIIESAYNSKKQLLWGQMEAPFQVPQPSIESGEQFGLFGGSEPSASSSDSGVDPAEFGKVNLQGEPVLT